LLKVLSKVLGIQAATKWDRSSTKEQGKLQRDARTHKWGESVVHRNCL